jgi:D-alanyl-D-alanine carboxypeptidase
MTRVAIVAVSVIVGGLSQQTAPTSAPVRHRLQTALDEWRVSVNAPGASLGVVLNDGTAIGLVSGVSDRAAKAPMRVDDLLMAGSTGKTFFAAVALQLIEAGRLDLNAPISKYLGSRPWFAQLPNANAITVRMLMTHTSGLVRYEMNPTFTADLRANPDKRWTPEEEITYLFESPAPFAAGQGWEYSDTNYIVLGLIMEGLTGTPLYDEVARRLGVESGRSGGSPWVIVASPRLRFSRWHWSPSLMRRVRSRRPSNSS